MLLHPNFVKPRYGAGCFADLPSTIIHLLTGESSLGLPLNGLTERYKTVILLFLDSFGWRFFERFQDQPLLKEIADHGAVAKLTSQFPSTTAAHVTCIHTGLPVGRHSIFEWQYYEPKLDAIIAPLLFSLAGTTQRELLKKQNVDAGNLFPTQTLYQTLAQHDIQAHVLQDQSYARSTYSQVMLHGANSLSYRTLPEALTNLSVLLDRPSAAGYYLLYYDKIDGVCHDYGPNSQQLDAELEATLTIIDRLFLKKSVGKLKNTLLIITADHGQTAINPDTAIYLNLDKRFSGLERLFKINQGGELLVPAGSCRDMFLYIKEDLVNEAQAFLAERLAGVAEVYQTADLAQEGFFGPSPVSRDFQARVGNLVILPYVGQAVWWFEKDRFWVKHRGHHGGLTPEEMEIPFLAYSF